MHAGIFALVFFLASLSGPALKNGTEIVPDFKQAVHLILPQDLTQKAPNKGKVAKEVNVEDLKPRPRHPSSVCRPRPRCERSNRRIRSHLVPRCPLPPRIAEPPKIETPVTAQNAPPVLPALAGTPKAPPTQIQPVEQPKLAFETPGQNGPSQDKGQAKLNPPKTSVQEAIRDIARGGGGQGRIVVGDQDQPPDSPKLSLARSAATAGQQLGADERHQGSRFQAVLDPGSRSG